MVLVRGDCEKPKQQAIDHTEVLEIITEDLGSDPPCPETTVQ